MAGKAHKTFWAILNQIKNIEVILALVNTGTLPQDELVNRLKSLVTDMQEPLTNTRNHIDFFERNQLIINFLQVPQQSNSTRVPAAISMNSGAIEPELQFR